MSERGTRIPQNERTMTCAGCGQDIIVCGYVDDLDPVGYRGVVCGCRRTIDARAVELRDAIDQARVAQETAV